MTEWIAAFRENADAWLLLGVVAILFAIAVRIADGSDRK